MTAIQHAIGPTFGAELLAVSLVALPIVWNASEVSYDETILTSAQVTSLEAVVAAHDPTKQAAANTFDTGLGWKMAMTTNAQSLFTSLATTIMTGQAARASDLTALAAWNAITFPIQDADGTPHTLAFSDLLPVLAAYGVACAQAWAAENS